MKKYILVEIHERSICESQLFNTREAANIEMRMRLAKVSGTPLTRIGEIYENIDHTDEWKETYVDDTMAYTVSEYGENIDLKIFEIDV